MEKHYLPYILFIKSACNTRGLEKETITVFVSILILSFQQEPALVGHVLRTLAHMATAFRDDVMCYLGGHPQRTISKIKYIPV